MKVGIPTSWVRRTQPTGKSKRRLPVTYGGKNAASDGQTMLAQLAFSALLLPEAQSCAQQKIRHVSDLLPTKHETFAGKYSPTREKNLWYFAGRRWDGDFACTSSVLDCGGRQSQLEAQTCCAQQKTSTSVCIAPDQTTIMRCAPPHCERKRSRFRCHSLCLRRGRKTRKINY